MTHAPLGDVVRYLRTAGPANSNRSVTDTQLLERFLASRDEAAFGALVRRHGPMVLAVCRAVLRHQQDAEDAFQVTFLVLARHAATVRKKEALAGWLHGVAHRTALQARRAARRRHHHETRAEAMTPKHPPAEQSWQEIRAALDEEVGRLAPAYRAPFVLCCLEGRSREEAARELGLKEGTVSSRLARARKHLQERLARRGLGLATALAALALARRTAAAAPPPLVKTTVSAALQYAGGGTLAAGVISENAAALLKGVSNAMSPSRSPLATALLAAVGALATGAALLLCRGAPPETSASQDRDTGPPAPPAAEERPEMTVRGRVLGADGRPVGDAAVAVVGRPRRQYRSGDAAADRTELLGEGKTDADGGFRFVATRTSSARYWEVYLAAAAPGHGTGWQRLGPDAERPEATLRLPPEQVVRARLVDLQGVPAARVGVSLASLGGTVNGEWDGLPLAALPKRAPWPMALTTDEQGRFEVRGCNRDRGVGIRVRDDRFAVHSFEIVQPGKPRPGRTVMGVDAGGYTHVETVEADEKGQAEEPAFTLAPAQVLEGRVVCEDTGRPVARASVEGVETDGDGRFRLELRATTSVTLRVLAPAGEPYLGVAYRVEWPKGAVRHQVEIKLPRGILVRGVVTEAGSGRQVAGAGVQFRPRGGNGPASPQHVLTGFQRIEVTDADGHFAMAVPPGPGYLLFQGPTPDYVHEEVDSETVYSGGRGGTRLYPDVAVRLNLPAKGEPKELAVTLRRGATVRGRLLDPDGRPVARAVVLHRLHVYDDLSWHFADEARDGVFEVHGLDPEKAVPVYFLDPATQSGAVVPLSGKQAGQELTVTLAPCGRATARYVDGQGKPVADYQAAPDIVVTPGRLTWMSGDGNKQGPRADEGWLMNLDAQDYGDKVKTDAEGRITFPALIPGATYRVGRWDRDRWRLHQEFRAETGKTIDLGDVVINKAE
jgi:RNA polymerase sigma factor (sigma-70 family)